MLSAHLLLTLGWLGYGALHSLLATTSIKTWAKRRLGQRHRYYRIFYNVLAASLLVPLVLGQLALSSPLLWQPTPLTTTLALALMAPGLTGMAVCVKKYFVSSQGFRDLFYEDGKAELLQDGLHRIVRHPLYLATFLFVWGLFVFWPRGSMLIVSTVITTYTLLGIQLEERKLVGIFGSAYEDYRRRVPMILPRLWVA